MCFSMYGQYVSTSPCYENPGCPELEDCAVFRDPLPNEAMFCSAQVHCMHLGRVQLSVHHQLVGGGLE